MDTNGHYYVKRNQSIYDIEGIGCAHCSLFLRIRPFRRGRDRSGLPKYARCRGAMVKHLHAAHRTELEKTQDENRTSPIA